MGCACSTPMSRATRAPPRTAKQNLNDQIGDYLTESQIALVRETWGILSDDLPGTGVLMFTKLFQTDRELRDIFYRLMAADSPQKQQSQQPKHSQGLEQLGKFDREKVERHGLAVMQSLGAAVDCLDDTLMLNSVLLSLGGAHGAFDVRPEYMMRLWPAVSFALKERLADCYTESVDRAWREVFSYIAGKMTAGMRLQRASAASAMDGRQPSGR